MLNVDFCHKKEDSTIFGGNQVITRCKLSSIVVLLLSDIHESIQRIRFCFYFDYSYVDHFDVAYGANLQPRWNELYLMLWDLIRDSSMHMDRGDVEYSADKEWFM